MLCGFRKLLEEFIWKKLETATTAGQIWNNATDDCFKHCEPTQSMVKLYLVKRVIKTAVKWLLS